MSLRERIAIWLAPKRGTNPIEFHPPAQMWFGQGVGNQPSHETLLQENIGVPDIATRAIANRIATLNPLVKVERRITGGTTEDEILDDHPLKMLLDRPHPNFSRMQLLRLTGQYIVTVGEAYWLKVGSRLGPPIELHPIPPHRISPQLADGVVTGYRVQSYSGRADTLRAEDVVRFYFPDPEAPWSSEGYLGPSGITADALKFSSQHLRYHYQNDATPKAVLESSMDAAAFSPAEKERFWVEWRKTYHNRVGTEKGVPTILPTGYKLIAMAIQSGADVVPLLEYWRDEQLMGMGVPRSVLGQVVSGDRSSAETNQFVFDKHTILPIATLISDAITLQLAPDFDRSIFVAWEPFVSDDKRFQLEQEVADVTAKIRSVNQVREDRGLDPVEWGEEPIGKLGEVPYRPDDDFEMLPDLAGAIEDEPPPEDEEPEEGEPRGRNGAARTGGTGPSPAYSPRAGDAALAYSSRAAFFHPRAEWQRQVNRERKFVPATLRALRAIFREQRDSVLASLKEAVPRARVTVDEIFTEEEWRILFERRVEPIRERAFLEILAEALTGLGVDDFVFTDAMRLMLREQGALLIKRANATTKKLIAEQLEVATVEGEGVDAIAKRIQSVFATRRRQARTIARTEMHHASQTAQLTSFELAEVERKRWNTSLDDAVRDSHGGPGGGGVDGQVRTVGDPFQLDDGELADAPGVGAHGSLLSAGNAINCRCFLTPVIE